MSVVEYDKTNVLVTYLPQNFTEMKFQELVASVGHLQSFRLIMRTVDGTKVNLGYGFAKYENEEAAAKAVKVLHGLHIQNKKIKVRKFDDLRLFCCYCLLFIPLQGRNNRVTIVHFFNRTKTCTCVIINHTNPIGLNLTEKTNLKRIIYVCQNDNCQSDNSMQIVTTSKE